jgi:hypothetical protein
MMLQGVVTDGIITGFNKGGVLVELGDLKGEGGCCGALASHQQQQQQCVQVGAKHTAGGRDNSSSFSTHTHTHARTHTRTHTHTHTHATCAHAPQASCRTPRLRQSGCAPGTRAT